MKEIIRHGDLIIHPIEKLPTGIKRKKDNIIAYGEITGHHHELMPTAEEFKDMLKVYIDNLGKVLFESKGAELKHQEHKTLSIPEGIYEVKIEREFDYFLRSIRQVVD